MVSFFDTAGGQCMPDSHCPTKTLSVHGDMEKRTSFPRTCKSIWTVGKAVTLRCFPANFDEFLMHFRWPPVELSIFSGEFPSNFRIFQVIFRWTFDELSINFRWTSVGSPPNLHRTFDSFSLHFYWFSTTSNSTLTNHDNLAYIFTPMMNFLRTIFTVYVNIEAYLMPFLYLELHQTNMKTIISVCRPPGATSSRLDGPSEKVQTYKLTWSWYSLPEYGRPSSQGFKAVQPV